MMTPEIVTVWVVGRACQHGTIVMVQQFYEVMIKRLSPKRRLMSLVR